MKKERDKIESGGRWWTIGKKGESREEGEQEKVSAEI